MDKKTLRDYFELTYKSNHERGAIFLDKEKKSIIYIYSGPLTDEHKNLYLGYKDIREHMNKLPGIMIAPIRQMERRVETGRYVFLGGSYYDLQTIVRDMTQNNIGKAGLVAISNYFDTIKSIIGAETK